MNVIQSIRFRIIIACIFFSIIVSVGYAWVTFVGLKYNSDELFNWYLTQETQVLLAQYKQSPHLDLNEMTSAEVLVTTEKKVLVKLAHYFPSKETKTSIENSASLNDLTILGPVFTTAQGYIIYELSANGVRFHVLKAELSPAEKTLHFYYLVDVSEFDNYDNYSEDRILNKFKNVLVMIFFTSLVIGFWLAKQVVSPLTRLAKSVDTDNYLHYQKYRGKFFNDEIGFLAKKIDSFVAKK